jgi:diguanylate cyclase (GGDEF)-like protein
MPNELARNLNRAVREIRARPRETVMMLRRTDDRVMTLVLAAPGWERDLAGARGSWRPGADSADAGQGSDAAPLLFVAELDAPASDHARADEAPVRMVPPVNRVDAAALREEALRTHRRRQMPDKLLELFEALNRADAEQEVYDALAEHAVRIVGAFRAQVLVPSAGAPGMLTAVAAGAGAGARVPALERFALPGLTCATEVHAAGGTPLAGLAPLVAERSVANATLAHVPFGDGGVLLLTERRDDRVFEAEDWDMLRALALQGEMTLRRVRLLDEVRSLALTDPLTGLANRRHMEVALQGAWGAARRGEPLAVIVVDLDDFKVVNDGQGHVAGDELLRRMADALRAEARGSDTVVRYGGDEFLVLLPGGTDAGARALVGRVRERLGAGVRFSAGVATYDASHATPEHLIHEADTALYENKRARPAAVR